MNFQGCFSDIIRAFGGIFHSICSLVGFNRSCQEGYYDLENFVGAICVKRFSWG